MMKYDNIESFGDDLTEWMQKHILSARSIILSSCQSIQESIKFNSLFFTFKVLLCYLKTHKKVEFVYGFYKGNLTFDEDQMLFAYKKNTRYWKFIPKKVHEHFILSKHIIEAI